MTTVVKFEVKSERKRDIRVEDGMTFGAFRDMLKGNGFDVTEAKASILRNEENDVLVGKLDKYVLKPGDVVRFFTENNLQQNKFKLLELGRKLRNMRISDDVEAYCKASEEYNKEARAQGVISQESFNNMMDNIEKARAEFEKHKLAHDESDTDCKQCPHHQCACCEDVEDDYDEEVENEDDFIEEDVAEEECEHKHTVSVHDIKVTKDKDGITIHIKG